MTPLSIRRALLASAALLLALIVAAPLSAPRGAFACLDGAPGAMDHLDLWLSSGPLQGAVYGLGDMLCHQRMSRSLMLNGSQLPFCARDVAVLAGFAAGLLAMERAGRAFADRRFAFGLLAVAVAALAAEWAAEWISGTGAMPPRAAVGAAAGFAAAGAVQCALSGACARGQGQKP